ncbi:MAG TPA: hypothetical protein PKE49_19105 [Leptospiraceae bacterium]|nr:hypothetical protein [Leptospirales bacterium]HMU82510.1 hypothetical protein [Leptospiraceae bacterium]HMX58646.1 hypothetical protein [Leptospiraceae bacterium]HNJ05306.1 hypothetical protein [Leptospiraceae bacterium]HNL02658.1 hypothetical protein [Leptospiraceae bacterium]
MGKLKSFRVADDFALFYQENGFAVIDDLVSRKDAEGIRSEFLDICDHLGRKYAADFKSNDPVKRAHAIFSLGGDFRRNIEHFSSSCAAPHPWPRAMDLRISFAR